jgi:uncharacterized protein
MKITGEYQFEAPLDLVYRGMLDPDILARALPGCEKLERTGDDEYVGVLEIKVGPVQGKFQGKVKLADVKEREGYTMHVDGQGGPGFVKAIAQVKFSENGTVTHLDYDSDVKVGGKMASVGQRLIEAAARAIVKQSLETLNARFKAAAAHLASVEEQAATPSPPQTARQQPAPAATAEAPEPSPALIAATSPRGESSGSAHAAVATLVSPVTPSSGPKVGSPPAFVEPPPVSASAFAASVAKEMTRELLPPRTLALIGLVVLLGIAVFWTAFR